MCNACDEAVLNAVCESVIHIYNDHNSSVLILIKLMEKKDHWAPYSIYQVKGTFGLRISSFLESNYISVNFFVIELTEGVHGAMSELMKRPNH